MMDRPLKSILDIIKGYFSFSTSHTSPEIERKRRAPTLESPIRTKVSRYSPYQSPVRVIPIERESDDISYWLPKKTRLTTRSPLYPNRRVPMKSLQTEDVVFLDDDDDDDEVVEVREKNNHSKVTSTPANKAGLGSYRRKMWNENSDKDVILVKTTKSPRDKQLDSKLFSFNLLKTPGGSDKPLFNIGADTSRNGAKTKEKIKPRLSSLNTAQASALDYTFRLDDKMRYKQLLEQSTDDSSIYHTPIGIHPSSFNFTRSSDKLFKSPFFNGDKSQDKPKESTKERIIKVLDSLETEPVVVKDSDSDDSVILLNPPSPKPDIKVDPVNSFKKYVDTTEFSKQDWLSELVQNHASYVDKRQQEIDAIRQCSRRSEELNKDINVELLRRKVDNCLQLKDLILPEIETADETEFPELTDEHHNLLQKAFRGDPNEVLVRKFNLNITRRDLKTLGGLNWLNDEVINFYMNLIIERGKDSKWPNTYAFNTFFYSKLIKDGPQSLRRWTKKVDLFSYDLICVPVHLGVHWCMAIIDFRDKSIRYFDSMGSPNDRCLMALRNYLEAEHLDKKSTRLDTSNYKLINMDDIPQQMNGSDCGMFSCTFAEFISRDARITFTQEDMPYLRKKMVVEIMLGELLIK